MGKLINVTLRILYTGEKEEVRLDLMNGCASGRGFDFVITEESGVFAPRVIVTSKEKTCGIDYFVIEFELDKNYANENLRYYADGLCTNDMCLVHSLEDCNAIVSNCLVVTKNMKTGECFGISRVTAFRFFTHLGICDNNLYIHYHMEDKPLNPDEVYELEKYIIGEEQTESFMYRFTEIATTLCDAKPAKTIPIGFCSWSRYYHDVNESLIINATNRTKEYCGSKGNLVQIDDGWQIDDSFPGVWETNLEKFPNGMGYVGDRVHENGQLFGLWLAPLLVNENSRYYGEIKNIVKNDVYTMPGVHPLDLDKEETFDHLKKTFKKMVEEYHADYFKIDFLLAGYRYFIEGATHPEVRFASDYSVALFRKAIKTIREAVGDNVLLLSCGAPMLECAGIFNFQRASCDIIWGKDPSFPTYWEIMKKASSTIIHRCFYNNKLFMNDPDGIVMRDIDVGDGFDCKYSEAKFWVASAFVSGGSFLHNEELENLSSGRRQLFLNCLPYLGKTGIPTEYFENNPDIVISKDEKYTYVTFFNAGEEYKDFKYELKNLGLPKSKVTKMMTKEDLGEIDVIVETQVNPHSAEIFIIG